MGCDDLCRFEAVSKPNFTENLYCPNFEGQADFQRLTPLRRCIEPAEIESANKSMKINNMRFDTASGCDHVTGKNR